VVQIYVVGIVGVGDIKSSPIGGSGGGGITAI